MKEPGGAPPTPPQQDPILLFLHAFLLKSAHVRGQHPPPMGNPGSATASFTSLNIIVILTDTDTFSNISLVCEVCGLKNKINSDDIKVLHYIIV